MLRAMDIRDMLLIDRLSLEFAPGLNVLTGETGAGKSILLDCLGFVLGWRGRAELVRAGAAQGEVTAVFDLPPGHPARGVLADAGIEAGDELILRRVNAADGRKTGWVNDRRVSGEVLRALSDSLVELHGQHDDRGLLNPRGHRALLDAFAGLDLAPVREAWTARRRAAGLAPHDVVRPRCDASPGDAVVAPSATRRLLEHVLPALPGPGSSREPDRRLTELTAREVEVLEQIAAGATNAEIATRLFMAEGTVKTHIGRLLSKLAIRDRVGLVLFAYETGLIAR